MNREAKKRKKSRRNPPNSLKLRLEAPNPARCTGLPSPSMTGPVLGLDLGTRRIGLAISNPEATMAFPAGYLTRSGGFTF